jgi:hypothetical protein
MKYGRLPVLIGSSLAVLTGVGAVGTMTYVHRSDSTIEYEFTSAPSTFDAMVAPHFKLVEPVSWLIESDRGDPQKTGPCGGSNVDWGKESNVVNEARGGSKLHLKLMETVYHPGHYRVALAVNSMNELPPDPVTVTRDSVGRGPWSVSAEIQNPAVAPVLADGLFVHNTRPAAMPVTFEADIDLPNLNCNRCVLQVVQWMADHAFNNPGGFSYHHCAIMKLTADPSKPLDTRWPAQRTTQQ